MNGACHVARSWCGVCGLAGRGRFFAARKLDRFRPSAVVLDVSMPIVDGWTVLRKLRSNPIVERLGVRFLLQKPYNVEDLHKAIASALNSAAKPA
jgi:CheY-like chemotaxis protein